MNFSEILKILEAEQNLPIKPDTLVKILQEGGAVERVVYIGVEIDSTILKGKFIRVRFEDSAVDLVPRPYSIPDSRLVIKVYYDKNLPPDERRLVVNKELLHIIDPDFVRTATPDQAAKLVQDLKLPRELLVGKVNGENIPAFIDYFSDYRAVVAMVSQPIRDLICEKYSQGKIDEAEIANFTGIPRRYVAVLLAEQWHSIRGVWLGPHLER